MEKELYMHFAVIKAFCNCGQQKQCDDLLDNMSKDFMHHHDFRNNNIKGNHDSL
jgi:hypothetical protein